MKQHSAVLIPRHKQLCIRQTNKVTSQIATFHITMYPHHGPPMPPPQKPETFMLSSEAQQSLPHDAQVALQQVDNRTSSLRNPAYLDSQLTIQQ